MSKIHTTLHKKGDSSVEIYPNIKSENIPDLAITTNKISGESVTTAKISDGAITTAKLSSNSVTSGKLATNSVTNGKISDGAVTTSKIQNASITNEKIADGSINNAKIQDGTIFHQKLSSGLIQQIYKYIHHILLRVDDANIGYINVSFSFANNYSIPYSSFTDITQALKEKYSITDPIVANGLYKNESYIFQVELRDSDSLLDLICNKLDGTGSTAEELNANDVTDIIDQML